MKAGRIDRVIKRNINNGAYDPEFISLERLKAEYGS